jgi:Glycosyl hydrolases family 16
MTITSDQLIPAQSDATTGYDSLLSLITPVAPPQAVAAGFSNLVFSETFSQFVIAPNVLGAVGDNGNNWGIGQGFNAGVAAPPVWGGPGLLTIPSSVIITTQPRGWPNGTPAGASLFNKGYFVARMRASGNYVPQNGNWFSFWLLSGLDQQVPLSPPTVFTEIDWETGFFPSACISVHSWEVLSGPPYVTNNPQESPYPNLPPYPTNGGYPDFTQFHDFGICWQEGKVDFYFDDVFVGTGFAGPTNNTDFCSIVLSASGASESQSEVESVYVWQA